MTNSGHGVLATLQRERPANMSASYALTNERRETSGSDQSSADVNTEWKQREKVAHPASGLNQFPDTRLSISRIFSKFPELGRSEVGFQNGSRQEGQQQGEGEEGQEAGGGEEDERARGHCQDGQRRARPPRGAPLL